MEKNDQKMKFKLGETLPILAGLNAKDILDNLEDGCYGKEEGIYQRQLSEEELGKTKSEHADVSIKIAKIERERKEAMDNFKIKLKDPKIRQANLLDMLQHKSVQVDGTLYLFDDPDNNIMYKVNEEGVVVDFRPLQRKEKQTVIRMSHASNDQ